jgi:hypothetical protein
MCFVWISEQTAIICLYSINWLDFIKEIYHFVAQWSLYVPQSLAFTNSTFCPHSVFMCFVWISEQTAIISVYSINWLDFIKEIYHFVAHWSLYVPQILAFINSTFCPHSLFMCFVWISEQTAIICLHSINWLDCMTKLEVCINFPLQAFLQPITSLYSNWTHTIR